MDNGLRRGARPTWVALAGGGRPAYPQTVGERPPNFEQGRPMAHAFGLLAKEDPEVRGLISDVYNLVRPASELDAPWVLERLRPYVERANA